MADDDKIIEIAVGPSLLRLPTPWFWKKHGSWVAVNDHVGLTVWCDVQGDDGPQISIAGAVPAYVPMVVPALVMLANSDGVINKAYVALMRYVGLNPETLPPDDAAAA